MGLRTSFRVTREFEEHIKAIKGLAADGLIRVDVAMCPMWVKEAKAWRRDATTGKELDENFNHAMSAFRYGAANIRKVMKKALALDGNVPSTRGYRRQTQGLHIQDSRNVQGPVRFQGRANEIDQWRKRLGAPISPRDDMR